MRGDIFISPEVAGVLAAATVEGALVRLTGIVARPLYVATDKVLRALGGEWDRRAKGHVFNQDAGPLIAKALGTGAVTDTKKALEQFDTPAPLAARMILMAEPEASDHILEPSAGIGALIRPLMSFGRRIFAVEIDPTRAEELTKRTIATVWVGDFLEFVGRGANGLRFDVVLMNPPFSRNQDIQHLLAAWSLLLPGGRLVAITSPHWLFASDLESTRFRTWIKDVGAITEDLPHGTFGESGTQVAAQLIFAKKERT